MKLSTSNN